MDRLAWCCQKNDCIDNDPLGKKGRHKVIPSYFVNILLLDFYHLWLHLHFNLFSSCFTVVLFHFYFIIRVLLLPGSLVLIKDTVFELKPM